MDDLLNETNVINEQITENPDVKRANGIRLWPLIVFIISMLITSPYFIDLFFSSSYYVAKLPQYSAGSVKVDGYMHKSKSCCEKVAEYFDADVIKVKPSDKAGTNSFGQTVKYEDAFYYCPLCN